MTIDKIDFDGKTLEVKDQSETVKLLIAELQRAEFEAQELREGRDKAQREVVKSDLYLQALRGEVGRQLRAELEAAEKETPVE